MWQIKLDVCQLLGTPKYSVSYRIVLYTTPPHHNRFTALFPGPPGEPEQKDNFRLYGARED